ncbi:phosphatidylethanolamine-binding protein [Gautieria morchelliformis]|nr:phosphatidylethanolamine-binding protein [Gautieria morchelliformis]
MHRSLLPATTRRTTSSSPRRSPIWRAPLRPGKLPAFDEALKYIRADARALRAELATCHDRARRRILHIQSEINLPEPALTPRTDPFTRPVYRHLAEQQWRHDGPLDLLMERLHQMHIIPDLLPALHPDMDLRVQFPDPARLRGPRTAHDRAREKAYAAVEPGRFLAVAQTLSPPRIAATVFHDDVRLYTLLMLDPDVPDESTGTYTTFLNWMQPNIPLSAARRISRVALLPSPQSTPAPAPTPAPDAALLAHPAFLALPHVPYIPPHPARGTPYHRYLLLMVPQPHVGPGRASASEAALETARLHFDLRAFLREHGMDVGRREGGGGGGAHMWRGVWTPEDAGVVSRVWAELGLPEPRYGRPPREDPYKAMKERRRYVV